MKSLLFVVAATSALALPQQAPPPAAAAPASPVKPPASASAPQAAKPAGGRAPTGGLSQLSSLVTLMDFANSVSKDLESGTCRDAYLIVARGSTESGNMGSTMGPMVCKGLRAKYGDKVGCQGVDSKGYPAAIMDNMQSKGTSETAIAAGVNEFKKAAEKCPNAVLIGQGYSQGAAVMHNVFPLLPPNVQKQVAGVILFGDTKNKQSNTTIEGLAPEKLKSFCVTEDGVCWGGLQVTAGHMAYLNNGDHQKAIDFAIQKIDEALKAKKSS